MWEYKVALKDINERWLPLASTPDFPALFDEVGGEGIDAESPRSLTKTTNGQSVTTRTTRLTPTTQYDDQANFRVVDRMMKQHLGELRSWTPKEKWHFLRDFEHDHVHPQFRIDGPLVAHFPGPRVLESECPDQLVAITRGAIGPNGEESVCPDFDHPTSTISVPACSGEPGVFVRDTWGVTLSALFLQYGQIHTAAELYKVWLEADVLCIGRPIRHWRGGERRQEGKLARGARSPRRKCKQQGKAAPDPDYAIDSREGKGKGPGRPPARAARGAGKGKGKPLGRQRRPWTPSRSRSRTSPGALKFKFMIRRWPKSVFCFLLLMYLGLSCTELMKLRCAGAEIEL